MGAAGKERSSLAAPAQLPRPAGQWRSEWFHKGHCAQGLAQGVPCRMQGGDLGELGQGVGREA